MMHISKIIPIFLGCAFILSVIYVRIDWRYQFAPFFPLSKTNESKLISRNGILYTQNDIPFTGTAVYKGDTSRSRSSQPQHIKRVTSYKNGLKHGEETVYFMDKGEAAALPAFKPIYIIIYLIYGVGTTHTYLHSSTHYENGLKHGLKIMNYNGREGYRESEATYVNGQLHGMYEEFYWLNKYMVDAKNVGKKIGIRRLEVEYKNGRQCGIYRNYSGSGEVENDYITDSNGQIVSGQRVVDFPDEVSGRKKEEFPGGLICLEIYQNGQLTAQKIVSPFVNPEGNRETFNEIFYENGSIKEEIVYNMRNGKCIVHRKMHNGQLIDLFNKEKGIDRIAEFELND